VVELAFTGTVLTTKGLVLQAKVQSGTQLSFTKVKIGDGQLGSGQSLEALTDLISPKKTLGISAVGVIGDGTSRVRAVVTNTDLAAGFFVREIGVFATDPDDGEILYCVANAGNECDYLPTPTSVAVEQTLDILMAIGNATNVTAVINETIVLATISDITDHNNNSDAHNLRRWKAGRAYVLGDICFSKLVAVDSYKYFECTVAGTSGTTEPTWPAVGSTVTDGGVTWIARDLRVASESSDNSTRISTTAWIRANIQSLVSGCIAAVATAAGFLVSLGANGYLKLPSWLGGVVFQWGLFTTNTTGDTAITFPLVFPTALRALASMPMGISGYGAFAAVNTSDTSGFTVNGWFSSGSHAAISGIYLAVGY